MTYKATSKTLHLKSRTGSFATHGNPVTGASIFTVAGEEAEHVDMRAPVLLSLKEVLLERERLLSLTAKLKFERQQLFKGTSAKARALLSPPKLARFEELGRRIGSIQNQVASLRLRAHELRTTAETDVSKFARLSIAVDVVLTPELKEAVMKEYRRLEMEDI